MMEMSRNRTQTAQSIRALLATRDDRGVSTWQIATRIRERLYRELYRCERYLYAEWIDHGGEA